MTRTSEHFDGLLSNLRVDTGESIAARRDEITKTLNQEFRQKTGSVEHRLMVGSYGRWTATKGISDLDLLFILPQSLRADYEKDGGASKALARTRTAIKARYTSTSVNVDRLIVAVEFSNFVFEVQPVFENSDKSFSYPDTLTDSWKVTKPREEIDALGEQDAVTRGSLRDLCRLARAWKNKHGVPMSGLLIDTLAHNFLRDRSDYHSIGTSAYDRMVRDFFEFLSDEDDHEFYSAVGSRQRVRVKKRFQSKARKAFNLSLAAIEAEGQKNAYKKWRAVFGNLVPAVEQQSLLASAETGNRSALFVDTEEFIEDGFQIDIRYSLSIDCVVQQDGFRSKRLRDVLRSKQWLSPKKHLTFTITETDVPPPYQVKWKVLNRGPEAERRNAIRGQIVNSSSGKERREHTEFQGNHDVECYLVKGGVVVARDAIEVPIVLD